MSCPHCQESARFVGYREKTVESLVGTFPLKRAYYHCRSCSHGRVPWDETLGLSRQALTPGASEVVCLVGAITSFAEGADMVLQKVGGLQVSESTVQRTSEAVGHDIGQRLDAGETFGASTPWSWHKDAEGKTCAYVSIDLTGLGMQGPHGAAAAGRMAAVGMIYNPVPDDPAQWSWRRAQGGAPRFQARYVAGLDGQASLAEPLRKQAAQVGMDQAQRWIALSDGGSGLEDLLQENFGRVEAVILDFYHVTEYLGNMGRALYPRDEEAREQWLEQWCHRLKHEGGEVVLEALRTLPTDGCEGLRKVHSEVVTYFKNNAHRMNYPNYLAKGWAIGSGPVEAACKTVVGKRMKGGGMRWGGDGADQMCHLRALFNSGEKQWDAYWHPDPN
ncbi:MAG TPA: ISKra4 family transposase [Fimbriimonas sp.]|nr:ISKra4 family transposase [Fimbriimonas sp.]